jgi:multiple sugar transport system ATP-binding protein
LSGGERQRVAIGRALVRDPSAFLMDEPIAALDARLREEMRVELKRLQREQNHTLVYVTHDQEEAMSVADRMAIFEDGRIRQVGTPADIYNRPNSRYVAELIGSPPMNFVDGTIGDGKFTATQENVTVSIDGVTESGAATLAIRPEDIEIRGSDQPGIDAKVYEVEPLGAFTIVDIIIGEKILKVQVAGQPEFELGSAVRLFLDPLNCHLFDGASGDIIAHAKQ